MKSAMAVVLVAGWVVTVRASPVSDLSSPSPETRNAAAKILRATYTPPPRDKWDALIATLKPGEQMTNVEARLRSMGMKRGLGSGEQMLMIDYRCDEAWILQCDYRYQGPYRGKETLYDWRLKLSPIYFAVKAPTNFTGTWIEFYINGQKCLETVMKDGVRCGDRICYDSTGKTVYVEQYDSKQPNKALQPTATAH
jgi:hypothetical protein